MSRRVIPNLKINIIGCGNPDFSNISKDTSFQKILRVNTLNGIREAIKRRSKHAKIIEINSTGDYITIDKEDFSSALDSTLCYFEKIEDYETCDSIMKLKREI